MSKFLDQVDIEVCAGKGGDGSRSMRREPFVPRGGPDGGDGGRGGHVALVADPGLNTLLDFSRQARFKAADGGDGASCRMSGRCGNDLRLRVPLGTLVRELPKGEWLCDLCQSGQEFLAARGGRGGRGNVHFKSSRNQAPRLREKGEPGEARRLRLELKLLADVAVVGFPNAGKSTLLSRVSAARPKIAAYPFTTLVPQLGLVRLGQGRSFVLADLPGLIEGASLGKGLGQRFLRHIERTRVLLFLLDGALAEAQALWAQYAALQRELKSYKKRLLQLPCLAAVSKADLPTARQAFHELQGRFRRKKTALFLISAADGTGIRPLLSALHQALQKAPAPLLELAGGPRHRLYKLTPRFTFSRQGSVWVLAGSEISKWAAMTDFGEPEARQRFHKILQRMGVSKALRQAGAQEGDRVRAGGEEFEYVP